MSGWNCRHTFAPYVDGAPRVWSEEELKKLDEPRYNYNGKKLTEYEAQQVQRKNERNIRRWKREYAAMDAAGLDSSEVSAKLKAAQATQRDFIRQTGLKRQSDREQINVANFTNRSILNTRGFAMGMRQPPSRVLTQEDIDGVLKDADSIGIDRGILRFNTGNRTGFSEDGCISVCGDILPDINSKIARDRMSQRAVLAHEYYGHKANDPSEYNIGDWRDEFRANYSAATDAPNLSSEDRALLMIDAYDRAREAGEFVNYNETAKRIIYGYGY